MPIMMKSSFNNEPIKPGKYNAVITSVREDDRAFFVRFKLSTNQVFENRYNKDDKGSNSALAMLVVIVRGPFMDEVDLEQLNGNQVTIDVRLSEWNGNEYPTVKWVHQKEAEHQVDTKTDNVQDFYIDLD